VAFLINLIQTPNFQMDGLKWKQEHGTDLQRWAVHVEGRDNPV
jgi:hypothetical protein